MERVVFVYTTWPTTVEAEEADVERGEETVMIVKTRATLAGEVERAVKELHSYDTPAILVVPLESVESRYLGWLLKETEPQEK